MNHTEKDAEHLGKNILGKKSGAFWVQPVRDAILKLLKWGDSLFVSIPIILFGYYLIVSVCHFQPSWPLNIRKKGLKSIKMKSWREYFR